MKSARQPPVGRRNPPDGFDFTLHMQRLCQDMAKRMEALRHVDMSRVAVSFAQTRRAGAVGLFAALTPMRFADGKLHTIRRKRRWGIQRLYEPDGREMLYVLNFYLPRFLDLPFREKLNTTVHELWHISPKFNGDVRRLGSRCFAHGSSQKDYDAQVEALLERWLALDPPESLYGFLRSNFSELTARHGRVFGRRVPTPKLVPVD